MEKGKNPWVGFYSDQAVREARKEKKIEVEGYPLFNTCPHTLIDLSGSKGEMHTLSIKLPDGHFATVCLISNNHEEGGCLDIQYHGEGNQRLLGMNTGASQNMYDMNLYALIYDKKE